MYKFLLRRRIKKIIKRSERKKAYHNLKEIKTILVLFDTEDYEDATHFIQQMKKMGKKIKTFAYKDKKDTRDYSNILNNIVTVKDMMDLKGESLAQIKNVMGDETFDLVVDLTLKENLLLIYLLVSANSPLKVGFYKHDLSVHDMVISFAPRLELAGLTTIKELGKQLIYYLTIISSDSKITDFRLYESRN